MSKAYQVVRDFEQAVCDYTGALHAVAVESCSAALFLCCQLRKKTPWTVSIPGVTYPSAAAAIVHAGATVEFREECWQEKGWYCLVGAGVVDSAKYFARDMYSYLHTNTMCSLVCLSFHAKKYLPIGRGGMILCNNCLDYNWLKCARFDGRHECSLSEDKLAFPGWNMYMTPEQAARGLELMQWIPDKVLLPPDPYQDLSQYDFWNKL